MLRTSMLKKCLLALALVLHATASDAGKCVTPNVIGPGEKITVQGEPYRFGEGCIDLRKFRGQTIDIEVISSGGSRARLNLSNYLSSYKINRITPVLNSDLLTLTGSLSEIGSFSMTITLVEGAGSIPKGKVSKLEKPTGAKPEEVDVEAEDAVFKPVFDPVPDNFVSEPVLSEELVRAAFAQANSESQPGFSSLGPERTIFYREALTHESPYSIGRCDPNASVCISYRDTSKFRENGSNWCNPPFVNFAVEKSRLFQNSTSASLVVEHGQKEMDNWVIEPSLEDLQYIGNTAGRMCPGAYVAVIDYYWSGFQYPLFRAIVHLGSQGNVSIEENPDCFSQNKWTGRCRAQFFDTQALSQPKVTFREIVSAYSSDATTVEPSPNKSKKPLNTLSEYKAEAERILTIINTELAAGSSLAPYAIKNCQWTAFPSYGKGVTCFLVPATVRGMRGTYAPQIQIYSATGIRRALMGGYDGFSWPRSMSLQEMALKNVKISREFILAAAFAFHPGPEESKNTENSSQDAAIKAAVTAYAVQFKADIAFRRILDQPLDKPASVVLWESSGLKAVLDRQPAKDIYINFQLTVGPE